MSDTFIAEIRTYTINEGLLDSYLRLYNQQIVPNHRKYGINVLGAWADRSKNQVTWIRTFPSLADRKAKLDAYEVSPERDAVFPIAAYHMAKAEVTVLESVFAPSAQPEEGPLTDDNAKKAMAAMRAQDAGAFAELKASTAAPR
jgi:hypothetical protein